MIQNVTKDNIYGIFASAGNAYYSIPKYQREYTWSYKEWDAFYDDISENNHGYFIGSIIYIPSENEREVIDGQQRLTTISLFLAAIYTRLKEYKDYMDEDEEDMTLTDFTLHFSCCFTKILYSQFNPLLNNFTMQEKCY